jgi:hypothetical protein
MQLLVIQFTIKIFHIGFMQVLAVVVEISTFETFKNIKIVLFVKKMDKHNFVFIILVMSVSVYNLYV